MSSTFEAGVVGVYIAERDFHASINGALRKFNSGDIISKPYMIDELLKGKCPIVKYNSSTEVTACPHCGHKFFN